MVATDGTAGTQQRRRITARPFRGAPHPPPLHSSPPERNMSAACSHTPPCPEADAADRQAARISDAHPEQGSGLLCNGVLIFEDTGQLPPNGQVVAPCRSGVVGRTA